MSQGACSDHCPQGGATEHHAPEQVFKRFASCSNAMTEEGSVCINSSGFSSRIDMNSACKDSIVRCIGMIVASNCSRNGSMRFRSQLSLYVTSRQHLLVKPLVVRRRASGFALAHSGRHLWPMCGMHWAAPTAPSKTSFFSAASLLRSPVASVYPRG